MILSLITFITKISEKEEALRKEDDVVEDENDNNYKDDEWPELNINNKMSCATKWQSSWSQIISNVEKARNEQDQVSSKYDNNDDDTSQINVDISKMTLKSKF